jgi:hypothetical protein
MKHNIITSIGLLAGAFILAQSNAIAQDEIPNLKTPSSWKQYLDSVVESGDIGTWTATGVTKDLWVGIPAGIRYVSNETIDISHDKKKLLMAHEYITEDGKMLSIGSGFVGWDPVAKRIYSFYSGYDGGKPFWGPRELVGFSSKGEVWKYTETSRGETYETQQVSKRTNKNSRTNITKKTDGTGEVIEVNSRKVIAADIAETEVEKKVKQLILDNNAYALKNLKDKAKMISKKGSLEFWSSGGLLQSTQQNSKREFDAYNLHPKHIKVIEINATTAVALYYVEGNYQEKESENNANYLTRAMEVYVKEEGGWKIRAGHWSPLTGGKGTTETAIKQ